MSTDYSAVSSEQLAAPQPAIPQRVYPTGMWLALGGILMFFTALVSAWVVRKGLSTSVTESPLELPFSLLTMNTIVLLASSVVLEVARRKFQRAETESFRSWWSAATVLGLMFLVGQTVVWKAMEAKGIYMASNPDASFFYLFTVAHAIHLLGGVTGLLVVAFKPLRQLTLATAGRVAAMYWHFLTAIWVGIFALLVFASR
jgi:cytochrome c oxidase subunit III